MLKILIDTNAMIYAFDGKKDINSIFSREVRDSFRFYSLDACMRELEGLGRKDVIRWAKENKIEMINTASSGKTDDKIIDEAVLAGFTVLTADAELIRRADARKVSTVKVSGNHLVFSKETRKL
ncbi:MAG: hypothetical protein M1433_02605 [Candidatus Parvarchaeota archaeon]|nr:hypothetical protein [Candidatus Parvarchaeota archaeon]